MYFGLASGPKKALHQFTAGIRQDSFNNAHLVIQARIIQQLLLTDYSPSAGLSGPKHEQINPGVSQCANAHRARFDSNIQRGAGQTVVLPNL